MASAGVNNIGMSSKNFLDCPPTSYPTYGWLSPRISFSREFLDEESMMAGGKSPSPAEKPLDPAEVSDPDVSSSVIHPLASW